MKLSAASPRPERPILPPSGSASRMMLRRSVASVSSSMRTMTWSGFASPPKRQDPSFFLLDAHVFGRAHLHDAQAALRIDVVAFPIGEFREVPADQLPHLILEAVPFARESFHLGRVARRESKDRCGNRIQSAAPETAAGDVVEERRQRIEVLHRHVVELVIVTACAFHRQAQKDGAEGPDAIVHVLDPVLLGCDAAFDGEAVVAVEGGGDLLIEGRVGQQITGELLGDELIEGHVLLKRADDPIPPGPLIVRSVVLVAVAVGEAGVVEPVQGQGLGARVGGQETIDDPAVGLRRFIGQELGAFVEGRRQPGQIERHAPQPHRLRSRFGRRPVSFLESTEHEVVEVDLRPIRAFDRG